MEWCWTYDKCKRFRKITGLRVSDAIDLFWKLNIFDTEPWKYYENKNYYSKEHHLRQAEQAPNASGIGDCYDTFSKLYSEAFKKEIFDYVQGDDRKFNKVISGVTKNYIKLKTSEYNTAWFFHKLNIGFYDDKDIIDDNCIVRSFYKKVFVIHELNLVFDSNVFGEYKWRESE